MISMAKTLSRKEWEVLEPRFHNNHLCINPLLLLSEAGVDPFEIFNNIFGGGGGRPRQRKTQDVMHKLSVSLEELYCGSTKKMALNRHIADSQGRVTKKKEALQPFQFVAFVTSSGCRYLRSASREEWTTEGRWSSRRRRMRCQVLRPSGGLLQ